MGIVLYRNAREIEYGEKIHGKIEAQKKRGRAGTALCIFIAFGFLSKIFTIFLYDIFNMFPEPEIMIRWVGNKLVSVNSLDLTNTLPTLERLVFFVVSLFSFTSILSIAFGIYLMFFNKFILRTRMKFLSFLFVGLVYWVLFGLYNTLNKND